MEGPLFSVIVTTHLRPQLLARSLASLRAQSFQQFEIILCADEGSSATRLVAAELLRDQDAFVSRPGIRGPAESRNAGLAIARGRYVSFLDDDDSLEEAHLAAVARRLETGASKVLYTNHTVVTESRSPAGIIVRDMRPVTNRDRSPRSLWVENFITNNSVIVATELAQRVSVDARLHSHEDWDYLLALLSITGFEHLDTFGPRVHRTEDRLEHRNQHSVRDGTRGLDYLSIYRKWPAPDDELRARRVAVLQAVGVCVMPQAM